MAFLYDPSPDDGQPRGSASLSDTIEVVMSRTWADIEPFLRQIEERYRKERLRHGPAANDLPSDVEEKVLLDLRAACEVYARSDDDVRALIRAFFGWSYILPRRLEEVAGQYAHAFDESGSEDLLRKAAVASTIAGGRPDIPDAFLFFKYLRDLAARKGIDAERVFMTVPGLALSARTDAASAPTADAESFASAVWSFLRRSE